MKHITPLLALLFLIFTSCSKHSPIATTANQKIQNLGVVEVSDGVQSTHDLEGGRVCIVTPTIQKDGNLLLALRIEEAGKLLASPRVITKSDKPFEILVGNVGVGFTPHIKN